MEDILELYCLPYDPGVPLVCMDEQPVQLIKETRKTLPTEPGKPARRDYEYERNGTANIFMFTEPLAGRRQVDVTERRTSVDWAHQIRQLLDVQYAGAERIRLVMDNLNTHKVASLYEAFEPEQARRLATRRYCRILCFGNLIQAASSFTPSMNRTPSMTSGMISDPFNTRQRLAAL